MTHPLTHSADVSECRLLQLRVVVQNIEKDLVKFCGQHCGVTEAIGEHSGQRLQMHIS